MLKAPRVCFCCVCPNDQNGPPLRPPARAVLVSLHGRPSLSLTTWRVTASPGRFRGPYSSPCPSSCFHRTVTVTLCPGLQGRRLLGVSLVGSAWGLCLSGAQQGPTRTPLPSLCPDTPKVGRQQINTITPITPSHHIMPHRAPVPKHILPEERPSPHCWVPGARFRSQRPPPRTTAKQPFTTVQVEPESAWQRGKSASRLRCFLTV